MLELYDLPNPVFCPECREVSSKDDWTENDFSAFCEDCGSHYAFICPVNDCVLDLVYTDLDDFQVKE